MFRVRLWKGSKLGWTLQAGDVIQFSIVGRRIRLLGLSEGAMLARCYDAKAVSLAAQPRDLFSIGGPHRLRSKLGVQWSAGRTRNGRKIFSDRASR